MAKVTHLFSTAKHVQQLFARAHALDEVPGQEQRAAELYREVVRITPRHWEAWNNLGVLAFRGGELGDALDAWGRALEIEPHAAATLNNIGSLFYSEQKLEIAVVYLEDSLRIDREQCEARRNLALALQALGRRKAALKHWKAFLRRWPEGEDADLARKHAALCAAG